MSDTSAWVRLGDRARALAPACGRCAFSPDERHLAWVEAQGAGVVRVTDLESSRTVVALDGAEATRLLWTSNETLAVLRRPGRVAALHVYAVPDGGELACVALPEAGAWPLALDASASGDLLFVAPERWRWGADKRARDRGYLVRGDGSEVLAALDPATLVAPGVQGARVAAAHALSPDGASVALVQQNDLGAARGDGAWVSFKRLAGGDARTYTLSASGAFEALRWTAPGRVMVSARAPSWPWSEHQIDDTGAQSSVAVWGDASLVRRGAGATVAGFHPSRVHPDGDQMVIVVGEFLGSELEHRALVSRLEAPGVDAPRALTLSRRRVSLTERAAPPHEVGACWDAHGRLVTLTYVAQGEGGLTVRQTPSSEARVVLHLSLAGAAFTDLSLYASPRRTWAVARWLAGASSALDRASRLCLIAL